MSNPNRRRRPVWCGDVDTTRPGGAWDVQDDGCCGPCKPPVPGCGPVRPPMPQFPDCGYHIPPVQYVPGMNEQEQLAHLNCKMNELIELFNCNTDKVFGAYEEVVRSAVCNDAFYKEITVESGYLADASTSYELVHIPFVDCAGQPIYMEMGLAYNNTTNSGVTESVFDKALEVYADKILPAAERSFQGVAIWKGAPIYSEAAEARALIPGQCDYTLGVTENGFFKIYDTPSDQNNSGMIKSMRQDKVRNSMGCAVIIRGGEYVVDENLADMELPCTVMAMNYKTKERFILAIGKDNVASAITPEMIANLLKKYDVDVAALTSWGQQSYLLDKGQFSFMPTSTDSDGIPTVPQSAAFWYITKRRHFHNDYVKEVAALTIQMGENLWYDELTSEAVDNLKVDFVELRNDLEQEIQDRKDADAALGERIDTEIAERKAADTALDEKYAGEVARLDGEIDALSQRVTDEVARLDALIESTKETLNAKDVKEVKVTHEGTRDTYQVVLNDGTVLGADMIVYNYDQLVQKLDNYATVEQRLDAEIQARKDADDALQALIEAEQQARANGDNALAQQIESVRTELTELIQGNTTSITGLRAALDTLTQTVQSNYTSLNERVTSNAENIANLQGTYGALQATVAALNETVTGLQQSFSSTEESFENVKQTVANMQTELNAFEERIEGELGNYLPLSGGTMGGDINMGDNALINVQGITFSGNSAIVQRGITYQSHIEGLNGFIFYPTLTTQLATVLVGRLKLFHEGLSDGNNAIIPESPGVISFESSDSDNNRVLLKNVATPQSTYDVANKKYVDNALNSYLPLSGGTMTGPINMGNQAVRDASAISLNGGTTSPGDGDIVGVRELHFEPSGVNRVAPSIHFIDSDQKINGVFELYSGQENDHYAGVRTYGVILNNRNSGIAQSALSEAYIRLDTPQDENTAVINFMAKVSNSTYNRVILNGIADPVTDYNAANKHYVDTVGENLASEIAQVGGQFENYLPLSGGTLTGDLLFNSDSSIVFGAPKVSTAKSIQGVSVITFSGTTGQSKRSIWYDEGAFIFRGESASDAALLRSAGVLFTNQSNPGGRISIAPSALNKVTFSYSGGDIILGGVLTPVDDNDVANKAYVDQAVAGGASGNYLPLTGGTVTGPTTFRQKVTADTIDMSGGPNSNIFNVMTVEFEVTQQNPSGYAIMRNGTLQGFGAYNDSVPTPFAVGAPTQDYHAATKEYVDNITYFTTYTGLGNGTKADIQITCDELAGIYLITMNDHNVMVYCRKNQSNSYFVDTINGSEPAGIYPSLSGNMIKVGGFQCDSGIQYGVGVVKLAGNKSGLQYNISEYNQEAE